MAKLAAEEGLAVDWMPYELRPEPVPLPDLSGSALEQSRQKWASGVGVMAERYGMDMRPPTSKPRSRKAHEAAEYARERGLFEPFRLALFKAYFGEDRDIGQVDVLVDVGGSVGLDAADLRHALESDRMREQLLQLEAVSQQLGVRAVPTIVIGNYAVEGAQPLEVLRRVLQQARAQQIPD